MKLSERLKAKWEKEWSVKAEWLKAANQEKMKKFEQRQLRKQQEALKKYNEKVNAKDIEM